jgi:hypothetical protein
VIAERQAQLDALIAEFLPARQQDVDTGPEWHRDTGPRTPADDELLDRAYCARNGERVFDLYHGDTTAYGEDHSRADQALANLLAFWVGPDGHEQLDRLISNSELGARDKWLEREDYARRTINRAIAGCSEFHSDAPAAQAVEPAAQAVEPAAPESAPLVLVLGRRASELLQTVPEEPRWLIPGIAAHGWMVKFAAREKTGKGTFVVVGLLGPLERGEPTVFGSPTEARALSSLILTEEPDASIREKAAPAGLCLARIVPGYEAARHFPKWKDKAKYLVDLAGVEGHELLFIDNFSRAAGVEEEAGTELARAAEWVGDLARAGGITLLLDHHHKKGAGKTEDKSRGGTAFAGACDNNIEIVRVGDWTSRTRKLSSRGRLSSTIWEKTIQLTEDWRYEIVGDGGLPERERVRIEQLQSIPGGVTSAEYAELIGVSRQAAQKVLDEFVTQGRATKDTSGRAHRWFAAEAAI